eukprot:5736109-Prorocentrum_lima.AAC.1
MRILKDLYANVVRASMKITFVKCDVDPKGLVREGGADVVLSGWRKCSPLSHPRASTSFS